MFVICAYHEPAPRGYNILCSRTQRDKSLQMIPDKEITLLRSAERSIYDDITKRFGTKEFGSFCNASNRSYL